MARPGTGESATPRIGLSPVVLAVGVGPFVATERVFVGEAGGAGGGGGGFGLVFGGRAPAGGGGGGGASCAGGGAAPPLLLAPVSARRVPAAPRPLSSL